MQSEMASPPATPLRLSPTYEEAEGGSSSRSSSPDSNCPICLGKVNNKAFTDACFHTFCFVCLLEWSKVRPTCPLCKTTFKSIIHNVVSNDIYDQYHLKPSDTGSFGTDSRGRRFRYSTTLTEEHRVELTWRRNRALERRYQRAHEVHLQAAAVERRRMIYRAGLWVRHMGSNRFTRFRDISPEFFQENPATTHRLVPWLRRELGILFSGEDHVTFMTQYILSLIPNVHIQTEEFHEHLRPFLYGQTEHFIHEFVSFARSPYDMNTYDQIAQYDLAAAREPQQAAPPAPPSQQSSSEYNDVITLSSDDEVIEVPTLRSLLQSDSTPSTSSRDAVEQVEALDLSSTHNPEPPCPYELDPDQAGPSGMGSSQPVEVKAEQGAPRENVISDDDSDIEIVEVLKPYDERTPECIVLLSSSTEEDQDRGESRQEKKGGKRHKKKKHTSESRHKVKQRGEHSHPEKSHRHSRKKKHKGSKHHKHSSSTRLEREKSVHGHLPKPEVHSSYKHHRTSRSRSHSKSSSSSHHTWRSSQKESNATLDECVRDYGKGASTSYTHSAQSHPRSRSRQRSEETYVYPRDTHGHDRRHRSEGESYARAAQKGGKPDESWEVHWHHRSTDVSEHSRRQHNHDHHYKATLSRKHNSSDSKDDGPKAKIRRPADAAHSSGLHLKMVFSRTKTTTGDDPTRSSSSSDFAMVRSGHRRRKHDKKYKKHKRHKSDSNHRSRQHTEYSKDKPSWISFLPLAHYHNAYRPLSLYDDASKSDDQGNDGDESSASTEEEGNAFV